MLWTATVMAQGPADWWFFGSNAGVHFTPTGPVSVGVGQMVTAEGNSSISTFQGDLQFYSDGSTVWDKNHNVMPNGTGLLGNSSSTHSGVIFPNPGDPNSYFILTVDDGNPNPAVTQGLHYSKVDMTLNGGNGDVVVAEKNVFLADSTSEKIAGTSKTGGFWAIAHKHNTDTFMAFEITAAGVNTTPVVSATGWETSGFGYGIKISPSGTKLAAVYFGSDSIFMYDFNLQTGEVTPAYKIGTTMGAALQYGLEFSPNEQRLYLQAFGSADVRQFDLTAATPTAISLSETVVGLPNSGGGQLQLGPDKKIYCARNLQDFLSVIHEPNELGAACNWEDTGLVLQPGTSSRWGLTAFIPTFFLDDISGGDHCFGDSVQFSVDTVNVDSIFWDFGDPASGAANTSALVNPKHLYTDTGTFTVTLIARSALDSVIDTTTKQIFVYPRQTLDLGPDTLLCTPQELILDIQQDFSTYLWGDSSTADTLLVSDDDTITVTLFGVCDTLQDTIVVRFDDPVQMDLGPDTTFCTGLSYLIEGNVQQDAALLWNTGEADTDELLVISSGTYRLTAENGCGIFEDSVTVTVLPIPALDTNLLPEDTINCFANTIILEHDGNDSINYLWSDGSSAQRFEVDSTQTVWLSASNDCGFSSDTINIIFNPEITTELGEDTIICDDDTIQLFGTDTLASYVWNTGDTTDTIWSTPERERNYIVTITLGQCQKIESRQVLLDPVFCPNINCELTYGNVFTPNGDGVNDRFVAQSDCDVFRFDMAIYNRWGQLVHYSDNIAFGWDGSINGEPAPEGTYYFVIEYKDLVVVDADRQITRGSFHLLR